MLTQTELSGAVVLKVTQHPSKGKKNSCPNPGKDGDGESMTPYPSPSIKVSVCFYSVLVEVLIKG